VASTELTCMRDKLTSCLAPLIGSTVKSATRAVAIMISSIYLILINIATNAASQQEILGLEARGSSIFAHGVKVKDSKATVRSLGSVSVNSSIGYLIGQFSTPNESLLMQITKSSDRTIRLTSTNSQGSTIISMIELSQSIGDKLIAMGGFDLARDGIKDIAIVDVSGNTYRWFLISNPLTLNAKLIRTFTLGSEGDIPDWFEARGRSIRFTAVRHRSGSPSVRLLTANDSGRAMRPINGTWTRGFGSVTTSQMRLGYRKDLGLALQSIAGDSVMLVNASNRLVQNKVPSKQCAGVQHITKVLRRGDVSTFESCPDRRYIVTRRGNYGKERTDRIIEIGSLGTSLYFMRRGDRTDIGGSELGIPGIPTPGPGAIVIPDPTSTPTIIPTATITPIPTMTPTPTKTPMNTNVLFDEVRYSTYPGESDVAIADYNGDGFIDIASAATDGRVDLLLGLGDGTFTAGTPFSATRANFLDTGDINNDGKPDIVLGDYIHGAIYSYLGNGDGTFTPAGMVDAPGESQGTELGDFNSDGKLDVACVSASTNELSIFFGNGDGTFTPSQTLATGGVPFTLKLGDLNGDTKLDIAVADSSSNTLSIFLNLGSGTFGARSSINCGISPNLGDIGDLNGDGKQDLVVPNANGGRFELFLGRGDGTFEAPLFISTQAAPFGATLTDFNRDGWSDVVITTLTHRLNVFLGNGDGTFQIIREYESTSSPRFPEAGDFNRDSYPDIAVAQYNTGTIGIYLARHTP
jgi:hypothetical protein